MDPAVVRGFDGEAERGDGEDQAGWVEEQVKKVFWTFFISMAGLILAQVLDPVTAQQMSG
ncbi:hypothetical protein [Methanoregula sp.]|uniref:hypothetical protein n=1 Tax=Methanoregula sp. TaxID=2052170 RepID=UPI00262A7B44|nr:hypothetical protein [Methanoregula sp.]MDD5143116.1 hypothetical protein [Methanoregula sp.]